MVVRVEAVVVMEAVVRTAESRVAESRAATEKAEGGGEGGDGKGGGGEGVGGKGCGGNGGGGQGGGGASSPICGPNHETDFRYQFANWVRSQRFRFVNRACVAYSLQTGRLKRPVCRLRVSVCSLSRRRLRPTNSREGTHQGAIP